MEAPKTVAAFRVPASSTTTTSSSSGGTVAAFRTPSAATSTSSSATTTSSSVTSANTATVAAFRGAPVGVGVPATKGVVRKQKLIEEVVCEECGPESDVFEDFHLGQMTCRNCGVVVQSQIVSDEAEWREFAENDRRRDDPNRVGGPENSLFGSGSLSTMMGKDKDGNLSNLARIHNKAAVSSNQAVLTKAFHKAETFAHKLGVKESVLMRTKETYKRVEDSKRLKSRGMDVVVTACLYWALRYEGVPRNLSEICKVTEVNSRDAHRTAKVMQEHKLHKPPQQDFGRRSGAVQAEELERSMKYTSAETFIPRWCSELGFEQSSGVSGLACAVAKNAEKSVELKRGKPATLAGVCIYLAIQLLSDKNIDFEKISDVCHIKPSTLKKHYGSLWDFRAKLIPPEHNNPQNLARLPVPTKKPNEATSTSSNGNNGVVVHDVFMGNNTAQQQQQQVPAFNNLGANNLIPNNVPNGASAGNPM